MPKTSAPHMEMIKIGIRDQASDKELGEVDLPSFCVDHMAMTPAEVNLSTMIKHIEKRCPGLKIRDVFVKGEQRTGISAAEIGAGLTLHVVPHSP